jgi:NAD-dependent dihydropyrimidine dehydrogenase PreA subunit
VHGVGIANLTDGLRNVGTPKLAVPDGYCMIFKDLETPSAQTGAEWKSTRENEKEELCSECINACPTGALEPITLGNLRLGIAVVNKDVCWAFRYNHCTFPCVEACVFDAIKVTVGPVVDAEKCVGCNQCSFVCVTRLQPGPSSITVEPVPT